MCVCVRARVCFRNTFKVVYQERLCVCVCVCECVCVCVCVSPQTPAATFLDHQGPSLMSVMTDETHGAGEKLHAHTDRAHTYRCM